VRQHEAMEPIRRPGGDRVVDPRSDAMAGGAEQIQPNRMREDVLDRLTVVSRRHIRHAFERAWAGKPIGPHALVFFYAEPGATDAAGLRVATRLFIEGSDVADLPTILRQLLDLAGDYREAGGLDPRTQFATRVEHMSNRAEYLGLGVSTLNPDGGRPRLSGPGAGAHRASPSAEAAMLYSFATVPSRAVAQLTDGTFLLLRSSGGLEPTSILSTHSLGSGAAPARMWAWARPGFLSAEPGLSEIAPALTELHTAIARGHVPTGQRAGRAPSKRWWRR
jgi:hypothetical protein